MASTDGIYLDVTSIVENDQNELEQSVTTYRPYLDWKRQAGNIIDDYLPLDWIQPRVETLVQATPGMTDGLPLPNSRDFMQLKVNQAYYPTGALRWGYGYLLCDYETAYALDRISIQRTLAEIPAGEPKTRFVNASHTPVRLRVEYNGGSVNLDVYVMQPRPVSTHSPPTIGNQLFIIPWVDERYWWQFTRVATPTNIGRDGTWQDLFNALAAALGVSVVVSGSIDTAYGLPGLRLLEQYNYNAAALLDAAAYSVGCRVVLDGGVAYVQNAAIADAQRTLNLANVLQEAVKGGTVRHGHLPAELAISFPRAIGGLPCRCAAPYQLTELLQCGANAPQGSQIGDPDYEPLGVLEGKTLPIQSTAYALIPDDGTVGDTPTNAQQLQALATRIKTDYQDWHCGTVYDVAYNGIKPWSLGGHDDALIWQWGCEKPDRAYVTSRNAKDPETYVNNYRYLCTQRVLSYTHNHGTLAQASRLVNSSDENSGEVDPDGDEIRVIMLDDLLPGEHAEARIVVYTPPPEEQGTPPQPDTQATDTDPYYDMPLEGPFGVDPGIAAHRFAADQISETPQPSGVEQEGETCGKWILGPKVRLYDYWPCDDTVEVVEPAIMHGGAVCGLKDEILWARPEPGFPFLGVQTSSGSINQQIGQITFVVTYLSEVSVGTDVLIDASGSSSAGGDIDTYAWEVTAKPDGSTVEAPTGDVPSITITPDVAGSYTISLTITDTGANSETIEFTIEARKAPTCRLVGASSYGLVRNAKPSADIQADSTGDGRLVRYDKSQGPEIKIYNPENQPTLKSGQEYTVVYINARGIWQPLQGGGSGRLIIGRLVADLAHSQWGDFTVYRQEGTNMPVPTAEIIVVLNLSLTTKRTNVTHQAIYYEQCDLAIIFPLENQICIAAT